MARKKSRHGVALVQRRLPSGEAVLMARWNDPESGKRTFLSLRSFKFTKRSQAEDWARAKAEELGLERAERAAGTYRPPPPPKTAISDAVRDFEGVSAQRVTAGDLAAKTADDYKLAGRIFTAWAAAANVAHVEDVTAADLSRLREFVVSRPKSRPVRGRGRGAGRRTTSEDARSPASVAHDLRVLKVLLSFLRKRGTLPVTRDDIADHVPAPRVPKPVPDPLGPGDARALLEAALRYDAASNPAVPSSLLVATFLLCGVRRGELLALRWGDLDAAFSEDGTGDPDGALRIRPEGTKSKGYRLVSFRQSPAMRSLLAAWRLRSGGAPGRAIFEGATEDSLKAAFRAIEQRHGGPRCSPQRLRRTAGSVLTCAPRIYGGASIYQSSARLGHGPQVAARYYVGSLSGLSQDARTVEDALRIGDALGRVVRFLSGDLSAVTEPQAATG